MDPETELVRLENAGWQALVDGTGRTHFQGTLADDAVVLMSGAGMVSGMVTGEAALDRLSGATWAWFRIRAAEVRRLADTVAVVTYRVVARRDFDVEYQAVVSSTYVLDDGQWKLRVHQQTPV